MHNLASLTQSSGPFSLVFEFCGESLALKVGKQPGVINFSMYIWINKYTYKDFFLFKIPNPKRFHRKSAMVEFSKGKNIFWLILYNLI